MDKKKRLGGWSVCILAVVLICLYPCAFMFCQNAGEAMAVDMMPFFGLFLGTAFLGLLICGIVFRNLSRASFITCLGMLVVINFTMVTAAIKGRLPWFQDKFMLIFLGLVFLGLVILLLRKKPNLTAVCGILALTFGVLTMMSFIQAAPKLLAVKNADPVLDHTPQEAMNGEKRNVYYLLFDEYGGDENLETYFAFDNNAFYEELEQRGFSISRTSRNTESCWTDTLVPNLLNLDYMADDSMPERIRREFLREPKLLELFRQNGYQINLINHRAFLRLQGANELTSGQVEDNISEYLFNNSIYCKLPVIKDRIKLWMFQNYRDNYRGPLENAFDALLSSPEATGDTPTLTISYIQCPHAPFVYNADGSVRQLDTAWYWKDETPYPGQLQYLNTVILQAIDNIQEKDPEAVILLLSDHGARVPLHMVEQFGGPRFDAEKETPVMQSMLCCAYIPGKSIDIEGDTGINMTRKVLDEVFDTGLGTITPKTHYVLDDIYNTHPAEDQSESSQEK